MWHLKIANFENDWIDGGIFESVTAAARRIRELEGYPVTGVFLEMHVDTAHGSDEESFAHLEHKGRLGLYVVKRRVN